MFLSLILKSSMKTRLTAESPFTSYFFVKNRLKMAADPFVILLGVKMSRDRSR